MEKKPLEKKPLADHQQKISKLVGILEVMTEDASLTGLTLEILETLNRTSDRLQEVSACVFREYFEQPPITITRKDFREHPEKRQEAFDSKWGYQIVDEAGKVFLSGGFPSQFILVSSLCPVCYGFKDG